MPPYLLEDVAVSGNDPFEDEIDVQHYSIDDDDDDDEGEGVNNNAQDYILIRDDDDDDKDRAGGAPHPFEDDVFPEIIELDSTTIERVVTEPGSQIVKIIAVKVGDTVELIDRTRRVSGKTLSGDFLRIVAIKEVLESGEVKLQGYRLRRCSYLRPLFDGKLNEVFMLIQASENDSRPPMLQGLEDIDTTEVLKTRKCEFTSADYEAYDVRMANRWVPAGLRTSPQIREWIFKEGTLVCRFVHTVIFDHNSVSYSGEVRKLYKRETDQGSEPTSGSTTPSSSQRTTSATSSSSRRNLKRCPSVEQLDATPIKRRISPVKSDPYTFGDAYCGIGGASEGAREADFFVRWGLDKDKCAINGYAENFPAAERLWMDAHDFPAIARRCEHGVDVLHLSCPCCYWSEAHTNPGKDDQANVETLLTVGPFLNAVKPRFATLEQAPGLLKLRKHRLWFRTLINEITSKKYNVRWKVTDQSEYGLPQRRRRLIFLCAKQGLPLPAFPKPVHGPKGSGLKYWVTIGEALESFDGVARDRYHQPDKMTISRPHPAVDPYSRMAKCITTSGGENIHPSGLRRYTPREIARLQGFPIHYKFNGSNNDAIKQAGNAWAPLACTKYFLLLGQFLEAYDLGLIDAEDDIDDLYNHFEDKGIRIPPGTRYLRHLTKSITSKKKHSLWGSTFKVEAAPRSRPPRTAQFVLARREQRKVREEAEVAAQQGNIIELD